jgi:HD-GYP domain-containing protein (c-di-GMP phosphodiesterase class II)
MEAGSGPSGVRLAELVGALSLATDLGLGQPQEHLLRQTIIARRLAAEAGLDDADRAAVFYVSMLVWVGCVSDSHEVAAWFGDDVRLRADLRQVSRSGRSRLRFMLGRVGEGTSPLRRLMMVGRLLAGGPDQVSRMFLGHCQATGAIADRLGLGPDVGEALGHAFERWDGKGVPGRCAGDQLHPAMRVVHVADDLELFHRLAGTEAAIEMLRARRASEFDPALVDLSCDRAAVLLEGLDELDPWDALMADDTLLGPELTEAELTTVLSAFGDYADLKSPSWLGHSTGVAALAADAARRLGLPGADVTLVERAALVHDLGVIGVSTGVWDKAGALSTAERERVRTHPYLTERILSRPDRLAEVAAVAALHHERADGSGYPRGVRGDALPITSRVVAAADSYHALCEARPHRAALGGEGAAAVLREDATAGRLDGDAVNAVLAAAGHRVRHRPRPPHGLTPREVEILGLLARGLSNKEMGSRLGVSARTVSSHVEHIYTKIGVSSRGAAAMFAMRHGLVDTIKEA